MATSGCVPDHQPAIAASHQLLAIGREGKAAHVCRVLDGPGIRATGLAHMPGAANQLLFSERNQDAIVVMNRTTGQVVKTYAMFYNGLPFNHRNGDMTAWPLTQ